MTSLPLVARFGTNANAEIPCDRRSGCDSGLSDRRKIGPADLKDALAKGVDDFWAMPTSLVFLGLIYPIVGMCLAGFALPLLFPLMAGFVRFGPFAAIGLYEISRRRELGLETSWAHAFELRHSPSIPSLLALGLLLLVIFFCWEFTAQSLYVSLLGSTPPESFTRFIGDILGTHKAGN